MPACVIVACALACGSLFLMRRSITRNEEIAHNDVAGPILTIIGTVLAVMISFVVLGVWQEYDGAAQTAQKEASALSDLHHIADAYPAGERATVQNAVDRYIELVITTEWPEMRQGLESRSTHDAAYAIARAVDGWRPSNPTDLAMQDRGIERVGQFLDARRDRILANREGIPMVLWATMLVIGAITVVFSFYFRVDRPKAQYIMVMAETAVITIMFTLIAELDYPFRGDIAIDPYSFVHVMQTLHASTIGGP
jgi:hypothetical protein